MESFGSPEEGVKLKTSVPTPHIIPSSVSSTPFLVQVTNLAAEIILVSERMELKPIKMVHRYQIQLLISSVK